MGRCTVWVCLLLGATGCGGDDEPSGRIDPAVLAAAPQATKDICERTCTAADSVRAAGCGTAEFATHVECYEQCVSRYLTHEKCKEAFDSSNGCLIDAGCSYQTQCLGPLIAAAACLQSG